MKTAVSHMPSDTPPAGGVCVYFDGSCPLCTHEIAHYAAQEGGARLVFVDVGAADAAPGEGLDLSEARRRFHVRLDDGRLLSGARAFAAIWRVLPRWRWAARLADMPGAMAMLELTYRAFLPLRPMLSRLAARCGAGAVSAGDGRT